MSTREKTKHSYIGTLTQSEISKILERGQLCHLGCQYKNDIYVVPVTYVFEDGYVLSHSNIGKKIELMRKNPNICIQVEEVHSYFHWRSVIAWGKYEELDGDVAAKAMRQLAKRIVEKNEISSTSSLELDLIAMLETAVIFRMKVERSTGRFEEPDY